MGYALLLAQHLGFAERFTPSLEAYWARLRARPAFEAAMAAQSRAAEAQGVPLIPAPDIRPDGS
ncbi:hypothetical protein M2165_000432 [Variovorax sp. TBS-050B]|nr:hypothetical protein [Variovorax sp. TBS-050B]